MRFGTLLSAGTAAFFLGLAFGSIAVPIALGVPDNGKAPIDTFRRVSTANASVIFTPPPTPEPTPQSEDAQQ